jgi:hypothetical protein
MINIQDNFTVTRASHPTLGSRQWYLNKSISPKTCSLLKRDFFVHKLLEFFCTSYAFTTDGL